MKIYQYLLCFICLFIVFPVFALGKRKHKAIDSGPTVTIRNIVNSTNREVALNLIYPDRENSYDILPGGHYRFGKRYGTIPLSDSQYDLVRFNYTLPEGEQIEEKFFLGISRTIVKLDTHTNEARVFFDLGIFNLNDPAQVRILRELSVPFLIHEHEFDHYVINIEFRGQDLTETQVQILPYKTQE